MNEDEILRQLEALDTIDREIARHEAAIAKAKGGLTEARALREQREEALREATAALEANRAEERAGARRIEELRRSRASAVRILESGAGSADAAERQLERCDALIDEAETAQLELMEAQDGLVTAATRAKAALDEAASVERQREAEAPGAIAQHEAAHAEQLAARAPTVATLPRDVAERYAGFRQRGRWAVARIRDKSCDACAMTVQPQMAADLQRGRLVSCHGCHRWLVPTA